MYRKVDSWIDAVTLEHQVQAFWKENKSFAKLVEKNKGKPAWSFLDGPITANNPMGVHHAWGRTLKDFFQRYWAMNGRELRYQNGFDCQGLWVEVEVEKEHGFTSKKEIEDYGMDRFVAECKERVRKFSGIQTEQSKRLGYWMDWDNSYFTMSDENNYTIWSFLKKCFERGKVYRGTDVMPWSGRSGTGYSQMEVVEGRKLVAHEALFVKFPLKGREKENLLVWTTTPWTLTSNIAAMINAELDYVKVRCEGDGEVYYFAADNLRYKRLETEFKEKKNWIAGVPKLKTLEQIFKERGGYTVEGTLKGKEMVGWEYHGPFDELPAQSISGGYPFTDETVTLSGITAHKVIDGGRDSHGDPVVVAGEGTGIVHSAPGCGDIDHVIGQKMGLPHIAPLDEEAKFLDQFGDLSGKRALDEDTVAFIIQSLKDKNLLVATEQYPHVYPHCWRSGDPLVFRLVDEWYINMDWRDEIKEVVKQIQWIPEWGQDRELEWLTNMRDWMISKKRYWGLALPIWVCEDCKEFEVIGGREELKERAVEGWDVFDGHSPHRPFVDAVKIRCPKCGGLAHRVEDVGNPWLDAGIVPYSTVKYNSDRDYWKRWIPADLVLECFPGQFRNWFYSLLAMSTMMENIPPFKTLLGHALVRNEQGREMHKSDGTAIWFDDAAEQMGADVMRWIYCSNETASNLNFGFNLGKEVRGRIYNTIWNTYGFLVNYARLENWTPPTTPTPVTDRPDFDRWILSNLQNTIVEVRKGVESHYPRGVTRAIADFVEDLSNWYIRHNRRRFWKGDDTTDSQMAFETLYTCVETLVRLIAPIMPHVAEEMYQNLVRSHSPNAPESVHHTDFPTADAALVDEELSAHMAAILRLNSLALAARENAKRKVRQPLALLCIGPKDEVERQAAQRFESMLLDDLNVKAVEVNAVEEPAPTAWLVKPNFKTLGKRLGPKMKAFQDALKANQEKLIATLQGNEETILVDVDGESMIFGKEDFLLETVQDENLSVVLDGDTWVSFDVRLTEELIQEGRMREVLRKLQVMRKDVGLEIEDRIRLRFDTQSESLNALMETYRQTLCDELLIVDFATGDVGEEGKALSIDKEKIRVQIEKAN